MPRDEVDVPLPQLLYDDIKQSGQRELANARMEEAAKLWITITEAGGSPAKLLRFFGCAGSDCYQPILALIDKLTPPPRS